MSEFVTADITHSTATESFKVLSEINAIRDEVIINRRWFHANPEVSFQEFKTAEHIVELLKSYGIHEVFESVGRTGVVALIRGGSGDGPCVALRADMDALPLQETSTVDYRSKNDGVMHACGHDGHISGLLAAAKILYEQRETFSGTVKLIFQPAEEGFGGAREMIKDGVLDNNYFGPQVDSIYGIHIWSCESC
jgi:amidohydrolase